MQKGNNMRWERQKKLFVCVIMILVIIFLSGCDEESEALEEVIIEETLPDEKEAQEDLTSEEEHLIEIYVYVCGEVHSPGVYQLESGNRIVHAIMAAGGLTDKAAKDYLNQAELLEDGQKIDVPSAEEVEAFSEIEKEKEENDTRINLNTADKDTLAMLSGIGESRAEAIIAYREENGRFQQIEDIMNVEGIKEGIFNRIKEKIKVE